MSHGCKAQRSNLFWGEGSKRGMGRSVQQSRHVGPWSTTPGQLPGAGLPFFAPGLEAASGGLPVPSQQEMLFCSREGASAREALTLCREEGTEACGGCCGAGPGTNWQSLE